MWEDSTSTEIKPQDILVALPKRQQNIGPGLIIRLGTSLPESASQKEGLVGELSYSHSKSVSE
jgi:hypothetical protein